MSKPPDRGIVRVSELRSQAQVVLDSGELPALDEVFDAVAAARRELTPAITEAQRAGKIHIVRKADQNDQPCHQRVRPRLFNLD
jgi:hypothetical protein